MNKTLEKTEDLQNMPLPQKVIFIENTATAILSHPEENLFKVQNLLNLLKGNNLFILKLTGLSLSQIFQDICPSFQLDKSLMEQKLKQVISKEERKLLNYEYMVLSYYEKYLQEMNGIKESLKQQQSPDLRDFEVVLLKSFTELYKKLFYFNFNVDLINLILKYLLSKHKQIQQIVSHFVRFILTSENHSLYKSKLIVLEKLGFFIKQKKFFNLICEDIWEAFTDITFEYAEEVSEKVNKVQKQEEYLNKMNSLKSQGKLSKRRLKELQGKE